MANKSYRDLLVWQKAFQLILEIYRLTEYFPKNEMFGLTSQMRRASISVASNIVEGYSRWSDGEFLRFLLISFASASELEMQLMASRELKFLPVENFVTSEHLLRDVLNLLAAFIKKIKRDKSLHKRSML